MKKIILMMIMMLVGIAAFAESDVIDAKYEDEHDILFMAYSEYDSENDSECPENDYLYCVAVAKDGTHIVRVYATNDLEKATNFYESGFRFTLYNNDNRGKLLQKVYLSDEKPSIVCFVYEMK